MGVNTSYEEKELLQRVADGDEQAFTQLFNYWYPVLSTMLQRMTHSDSLTEETVQEVFLKIWTGRESLTHVNRFRPFLWVMAKHLAINAMHKSAARQLREKRYHESMDEIVVYELPEMDYHTLIDEAIEHLPLQQKRVYLMSRHQRKQQAEIAQELGISIATVKSYMQLAVAAITRHVKEKAGLGAAAVAVLKIFS